MLELVIAFMKGMRNTLIPVGTFIVGFIIGLVIFGWWLTPVEYTGAGPQHLHPTDQGRYLQNLAALYAYHPDRAFQAQNIQSGFANWPEALDAICARATEVEASGQQGANVVAQQLRDMATVVNPNGCAAVVAPEPSSGSLWQICLYGLGLLLALGLVAYFWSQRGSGSAETNKPATPRVMVMPDAPPAMEANESGEMSGVTPIASYRTTYNHGNPAFDDSFSIETPAGDFLGECGVSISESIGSGASKAATAMEVWLFDKNDIRTITKVAMSDHAYFDDAIRAKLSPKGEPVLARPDEVVVLETAALIVNARITQMAYGNDPNLPDKGYFDHFAVEISVWAKDDAPTGGGSAMNFDDF